MDAVPKEAVKAETPREKEEHARRGPSTLKPIESCGGYVSRPGDSAASVEGGRMHNLMQRFVEGMVGVIPAVPHPDDEAEQFDSEQSAQLVKCMGFVEPLVTKYLDDYQAGEDVHIFCEKELDLTSLEMPGCEHGTGDLILVNLTRREFDLVDYKFGKIEVPDPEENPQFHAYGIGVFLLFKILTKGRLISLQPRLDQIGMAEFTSEDVPRLALRLKAIVERAEVVGKGWWDWMLYADTRVVFGDGWTDVPLIESLNPQTSLCEYCANLGVCPAVRAKVLHIVSGLDLPPQLDPAYLTEDANGLGRLFAWAKLAEEQGKALQKSITRLVESGSEVEGYNLLKGTGPSTILDPIGLAQALAVDLKFTPEQIASVSEVSISKVEAVVRAMTPKGEKEKAAQAARRELEDGGYFQRGYNYTYLRKAGK